MLFPLDERWRCRRTASVDAPTAASRKRAFTLNELPDARVYYCPGSAGMLGDTWPPGKQGAVGLAVRYLIVRSAGGAADGER